MDVILLERVAKLGQMGEVVRVKDGFARNFLLPKGKALRATDDNRKRFETMKTQLETRNLELKGDAQKVAEKLNGQSVTVLRQASETGQLYGSVSTRDIAALLTENGFTVSRNQIELNAPIKLIGLHKVPVALHPEVEVTIQVSVARNAEEAERILRGENVTVRRQGDEDEAEAVNAAAVFESPESAEEDEGAEGNESDPAAAAQGNGSAKTE
jgi:large subunit ribosomal protein L9